MLLEVHLHSKNLANSSATSGFVFDFEMCDDYGGSKYLWVVWTCLAFVLGFPASLVVLWEMCKMLRRETPLTPNDFFLMHLSIMDFVFLIFILPGLWNHFLWKKLEFEMIWNGVYCLSSFGRPLLMTCVCVDCYVAVVHPITYRKPKTQTLRISMVSLIWTLTVVYGIAYGFSFQLFTSTFSIVPLVIAIAIIIPCDSIIIYTLIKSEAGRKNIHPQKQRAIQTLINSLVLSLMFYLPPLLMLIVGKQLTSDIIILTCVIGIPITITTTLGSAIMPILYLNNLGKLDHFRLGCCKKT